MKNFTTTMTAMLLPCFIVLFATTKFDDHNNSEQPAQVVTPDKDVSPAVEPKEEPKTMGVIELQLADWCGPCRKFKASGIIEELEANGWKIKYVSNLGKKYPSFRLRIKDKSSTWTGYSSKSGFYKTLKSKMKLLGYPAK